MAEAIAAGRMPRIIALMTKTSAAASPAPSLLRNAATVVLLRDVPDALELFMVVRHHQIDFASGALVFPGGSLDPGDRGIAEAVGRCAGPAGLSADEMMFRVAAIREAFEECGVLLANRAGSDRLLTASELKPIDDKYRQDLCAGKVGFADMLAAEELTLATDRLVRFAHWITPEGMPKRFDTQFFMAIAPEDQAALHDGGEAVDSVWITAGQALADTKAGRFTLVFATERNLFKLEPYGTAGEAIAAFRDQPIVTVQPRLIATETGRELHIPAEAGYGGAIFQF